MPGFFKEFGARLSPERIYAAKTIGRLSSSTSVSNRRFVDSDLLPFAERHFGSTLVPMVESAVDRLRAAFGAREVTDVEQEWILKSVFRLLAGKVLKDKDVPRFRALDLGNTAEVLSAVNDHYGSEDVVDLGTGRRREALVDVTSSFKGLWDLRHLTTESLADVYEQALVDKYTRKGSGTHRTPSYLADYMVWQLAPWIEQLDPATLRVFEAASGHAPFLVSVMRQMRTMDLGLTDDELSKLFRQRLAAVDYDRFAIQVAKLSLTVADVPKRNGWTQVRVANMFTGATLEEEVKRCRVFFSNPPFEGAKPMKMLGIVLKHLQPGSVFGVIIPSSHLLTKDPNKRDAVEVRRTLLKSFQIQEVTLLPDGIFKHADHEVTLLLGRRPLRRTRTAHVRCRRVREEDLPKFEESYAFSTDRVFPQAKLAGRADQLPWVEELTEEVWSYCRRLPRLGSIAEVGQGLVFKGEALPKGAITVSPKKLPGLVAGFATFEGHGDEELFIHRLPPRSWLNLSDEVIRRRVTGTKVGVPQVLINYGPVGRGAWRLKALLDEKGHAVTSRFLTVRPKKAELPLLFLWAVCNSPLANAFVYTHSLKRDILAGLMRELPLPRAGRAGVEGVVDAARAYLNGCDRLQSGSLFDQAAGDVSVGDVHHLLRLMDAEVLRLYDLPARSERKLLSFFNERRPGVPGNFKGYYPTGFKKPIALYVFLSDTFQKVQREGVLKTILEPLATRFDELVQKHYSMGLTPDERVELRKLQVEVAGRDYAAAPPSDDWMDDIEARTIRSREQLAVLGNRVADVGARRGKRA